MNCHKIIAPTLLGFGAQPYHLQVCHEIFGLGAKNVQGDKIFLPYAVPLHLE